jgi:aryl-alcohol dehydrogenase-like predicted oxidoreductase
VIPYDIYVEGLAMAFTTGLTRAVGVSNFDMKQMQRAANILSNHGIQLASNQVEYSLLERRAERSGLLNRCRETDVRMIAYSPLAKGILTGKYNSDNPPPGPRGRKYATLLKELPPLIALLEEIGTGHGGKNPAQVALNWIICKGGLPIPGAKTAKQAEQNVGALGWHLTPEEIRALDMGSDKIT